MLIEYFTKPKRSFLPKFDTLLKALITASAISHVTEVTTSGKPAYLIILQDKQSWNLSRVVDGEINVCNEYQKG